MRETEGKWIAVVVLAVTTVFSGLGHTGCGAKTAGTLLSDRSSGKDFG